MNNHTVCAVVPVFNAGHTLKPLVQRLCTALADFSDHRIVLVDDGSRDGSREIIRQLAADNSRITGVLLKKNAGQQNALLCGLRSCSADFTVIIDDDFEHDPADIEKLYQHVLAGFDVVYGVNAGEAESRFRNAGARMRDALVAALTGIPENIKVCSFRILNRKTVQQVCAVDTRFVYLSLETLRHTTRIGNVPVQYNPRRTSRYHPLRLVWLLVRMIVYYAPFRVLRPLRRRGCGYEIEEMISPGELP